ncbi:TIGR02646 family protein [Lamprobacter modestohalophilus]|uniref:TIGR02646 family protein n=1 Tax=Lamprobacter modestohalophilus TaxID=1064514 RepID=A0A9X1B760_9GAMM|nr:retron system putative HNH endonuclease [Lamprobacter modestohalophilus]MBK1621482.1 TIGR02646 family protein [Lamprobacter modestohalophilus]
MKHIVKQGEPTSFSDWKALANDDWQPKYDDLRGTEKRDVKAALMTEQGHLCCYCEGQLIESDSHIEHFQPQSDPAVDPLDFSNLLCSCQNQIKKGEPRHCGNLKDDWYGPDLLVSPFDPGCEDRFAHTGDGLIKPASTHDQGAAETIKRLGQQ